MSGEASTEGLRRGGALQRLLPRSASRSQVLGRLLEIHPAALLTGLGVVVFTMVFGRLGVENHRNFGTWAYDMAIYDQAMWLVSRGESFMTIRGLDVWGHHVNLIFFAFVPAYWLGAGPSFLYVVQAFVLGLGAVPTYLIARDRFAQPAMGLVFAVVYLMYAPVQWISWAMFHPEALVITPFLFAWWCATRERWGWYFVAVLVALSTREDVALAVVVLGLCVAVALRRAPDAARVRRMAVATSVLGAAWYLVATAIVIPYFNDGEVPFYISYFYGHYGDTAGEVLLEMVQRPDRVVSDAVQPDRLMFYKQMSWPMGWVFLASPIGLLMALPQLLASVITLTPYARMIRYQYTAVMIAPVIIASISGAAALARYRTVRILLPLWLLGCAYVSNVAWSPSPIAKPENQSVWAIPQPRHDSLRAALAMIPDDASVAASYQLGPHLSGRSQVYDWPNPFKPNYWGNDTCANLPSPTVVEYVVLDKTQIGEANLPLYELIVQDGGAFEVLLEDNEVMLAKRVGTTPALDEQPQRDSCLELERRAAARAAD
ncbi:MAG: hypothetical protein RJB61_471 [Actinomycetota bacterium]|jgi:uncharacterized membrane protein